MDGIKINGDLLLEALQSKNIQECARLCLQAGARPVPARNKVPHSKWAQESYYTEEDFEGYEEIGLYTGDRGNGLVMLDLDHPVAQEVFLNSGLVDTLTIGRNGEIRKAIFIATTPCGKRESYAHPEHGAIIELLAGEDEKNIQGIVPPSKWKSKCGSREAITEVINAVPPVQMPFGAILEAYKQLTQQIQDRLGDAIPDDDAHYRKARDESKQFDEVSLLDLYNEDPSETVRDVLERNGWIFLYSNNTHDVYERPGKGLGTPSGTVSHNRQIFYSFTTTETRVPTNKGLSKAGLRGHFEFGGNFKALNSELRAGGRYVHLLPAKQRKTSFMQTNGEPKSRAVGKFMVFDGGADDAHKGDSAYNALARRAFPTHALPTIIKEAVMEAADGRLSTELGATMALGYCSVAAMMNARLETKGSTQNNIGLYTMCIGNSGTGKSKLSGPYEEAFAEWLMAQDDRCHEELAALESWTQKKEVRRKKALKDLEKANYGTDEYYAAEVELDEILREKPPIIRLPDFLQTTATIESIIKMTERCPYVFMNDTDGGSFLNGHSLRKDGRMSFLSGVNEFWSGKTVTTRTQHAGQSIGKPAGMAINLATQRKTFMEFQKGGGAKANESGFLERFLVAESSLECWDVINTSDDERIGNGPCVQRIQSHLKGLLNHGWRFHGDDAREAVRRRNDAHNFTRPSLADEAVAFDEKAKRREPIKLTVAVSQDGLDELNQRTSYWMEKGRGGELGMSATYIARFKEHVLRLATVLHMYEAPWVAYIAQNEQLGSSDERVAPKEVSVGTVMNAIEIMEFFVAEWVALADTVEKTEEDEKMDALCAWAHRRLTKGGLEKLVARDFKMGAASWVRKVSKEDLPDLVAYVGEKGQGLRYDPAGLCVRLE